MLRNILLVLTSLSIAIGGGAASVWYALGAIGGIDAISVSGWVAYPDAGTSQADPYTKARIAREATLPLGPAEGLPFFAARDKDGALLARNCNYVIAGQFPPARFWTLQVAAADRLQPALSRNRTPGLTSYAVMRDDNNMVRVVASRSVQPGNWLQVSGDEPMTFVLTLYDTPVASSQNITEIKLPQVSKVGCDA
ncbi:MAG: DUF1214 domain-containing protein [Mesorhizobium sp.]